MIDLIDLRKWAAEERAAGHSFTAESIDKAADEIERLTAKFDQIDAHITNRIGDKDAEIERLRLIVDEQEQQIAWLEMRVDSEAKANAKLQAVVDAADRIYADYEDDCNIQSSWRSLGQALAMWKEANDD